MASSNDGLRQRKFYKATSELAGPGIEDTVDVRKLNVPFEKQNVFVFEFQTFGFQTFGPFGSFFLFSSFFTLS